MCASYKIVLQLSFYRNAHLKNYISYSALETRLILYVFLILVQFTPTSELSEVSCPRFIPTKTFPELREAIKAPPLSPDCGIQVDFIK